MLSFSRRPNRFFGIFIVLAMLAGFLPVLPAQAISLSDVKDTLSDSLPSTTVSHTIFFTTSVDIGANGYFEVTLPAAFGDISAAICQGPNVAVSTTTVTVRCTYSTSPGAATSTVISLENVLNPATVGAQTIDITTYNALHETKENAKALVFVNNNLSTNAVVESSLTFSVSTSTDIAEISGIPLTGTSTATTVPFGDLIPGASSTLAQTLRIGTNADNGYSCTMQQIHELISSDGNTINSFDNAPDGSGSTTPHSWNSPANTLDQPDTYGHMGIISDDTSLSSLDFSGTKFAGLNGTDPIEIMYNNGPADENTLGVGMAHIGYSIEISNLQEVGSYSTTIMYICTPNF